MEDKTDVNINILLNKLRNMIEQFEERYEEDQYERESNISSHKQQPAQQPALEAPDHLRSVVYYISAMWEMSRGLDWKITWTSSFFTACVAVRGTVPSTFPVSLVVS